MSEIVAQGFLNRNTIEYLTDSQRTKFYRCNTLQNPLAYLKDGVLFPVNVIQVSDSFTDKAGSIWLRDKNIVSVGVKKADDAYKCIGLRPDEDQSGNEQFELSIENIEINGKSQTIDLSQKAIVSPVVQDLGPLQIQSNRQHTRLLLPMTNAGDDFRIKLRLHLTGLVIQRRADRDEYWIFNTKGKFRFRLAKPRLCVLDHNNFYIPLDLSNYSKPPVLVQHSLIDNGDGTWTYIKEPGPDFGKSKLPQTFWVDADIVYSSIADGYVGNNDTTWANTRNADSGSVLNDGYQYSGTAIKTGIISPNYEIQRVFFYFDVSTLLGNVDSCSLFIYPKTYADSDVCAMEGTQGSTLAVADYDAFTGSEFGHVTWGRIAYNEIEFNTSGKSYINNAFGETAKICCREYTHDYLDSESSNNYYNGCYFSDNSGTTYDPYLYITTTLGWTGKIWGVTNPASIWGIDVANIAKVHGL